MLLTMLMLLMVVAFAVAVDADAVNDCLGEALGIAAAVWIFLFRGVVD
jgi:hypothetical protein